jgi:hypothetical protein
VVRLCRLRLLALAVDLGLLRRRGPHESACAKRWLVRGLGRARARVQRRAVVVAGAAPAAADAARIATEFLTGYVVEKSLAVDNIFVFLLLFNYFQVPAASQARVLSYGVLGAIVLRALLIVTGAALLARFHWLLYLFGFFLLATGAKMFWAAGQPPDIGRNPVLRWLQRAPAAGRGPPRRGAVGAPGRRAPLHAAVRGAGDDRDHRHRVRGRLDPGHLRHHHRSFRGAELERVRGARPARAVLPARRHGCALPPAQLRAGGGAGVHRRKMLLADWVQLPILVSLSVVVLLIGGSIAPACGYLRKRSGSRPEALALGVDAPSLLAWATSGRSAPRTIRTCAKRRPVLERFKRALNLSLLALIGLALVFWLQVEGVISTQALSIRPQDPSALVGVLTASFLHGSLGHLGANAFAVLTLGTLAGTVFPRRPRAHCR